VESEPCLISERWNIAGFPHSLPVFIYLNHEIRSVNFFEINLIEQRQSKCGLMVAGMEN